MDINERFIKVSSKLPLPQDIQLGQDIVITIGGHAFILNCTKLENNDKQDGTMDVTAVLKYAGE
jgi:hypothetical protein